MSWSGIEAKWAAMARRVQSDRGQDNEHSAIPCASVPPLQREDAPEMCAPPLLDGRAA